MRCVQETTLPSKKNFKTIEELSKQVAKWIFLFNFPIFLLMLIFSKEIIILIFGSSYLMAENALRILVFGFLISSIFNVSQHLMQMIGKSKLLLIDTIFLTILNIILNFFLIPKYGLNGAAFSTSISILLLHLIFLIQAKHYTSIIPLRKKIANIILVSIIPLTAILVLKQFILMNSLNFGLLSILFLLLYFLIILLTKNFDRNDMFIIKTIVSRIPSSSTKPKRSVQ